MQPIFMELLGGYMQYCQLTFKGGCRNPHATPFQGVLHNTLL